MTVEILELTLFVTDVDDTARFYQVAGLQLFCVDEPGYPRHYDGDLGFQLWAADARHPVSHFQMEFFVDDLAASDRTALRRANVDRHLMDIATRRPKRPKRSMRTIRWILYDAGRLVHPREYPEVRDQPARGRPLPRASLGSLLEVRSRRCHDPGPHPARRCPPTPPAPKR